MSNNIGRLGADAIQKMKVQQQNAPQVEGQEAENSQTIKKPLSKSEVASMLKGNIGEPASNVNTDNVTTQEAQAADQNGNEPPILGKQYNNLDDLRKHGKMGDFCLDVIIIAGKIHYIMTYLFGGENTQELTEDQFNALKDYDGTVTGH